MPTHTHMHIAPRTREPRVGRCAARLACEVQDRSACLQASRLRGAALEHARDGEWRGEVERRHAHRRRRCEEAAPRQHQVGEHARTDNEGLLERRPVLDQVGVVGVRDVDLGRLRRRQPALRVARLVQIAWEADEAADRQETQHIGDGPARTLALQDGRPKADRELAHAHLLHASRSEVAGLVHDDHRAEHSNASRASQPLWWAHTPRRGGTGDKRAAGERPRRECSVLPCRAGGSHARQHYMQYV